MMHMVMTDEPLPKWRAEEDMLPHICDNAHQGTRCNPVHSSWRHGKGGFWVRVNEHRKH